jgi:hypothetical protein
MVIGRVVCTICLTCAFAGCASAQEMAPARASDPSPSATIALTVPNGTPLQVAVDREVRIRKVGQPIHGRIMQAVYVFDRLVVPAGSEVTGQLTKIESISGKRRTLSILNADFTPAHKIELEFDDLVLPEGRHIRLHSAVTPGSGAAIQFVTSGDDEKKKTLKDAASAKLNAAKQEAKREWQNAMQQLKAPGKMHRLARYAVAQLPVHPQYIDAGTLYFVELQKPIDFGTEPLTAQTASSFGTPPPPGSLVHALLMTPLNSATTQMGAAVEAVISQPLFDGDRLILPQGSRLKGSVIQVRPARHWNRNGQLRIVFNELEFPGGLEQKVSASLEGVQSAQGDRVHLDAEGGAEAASPKSRYFATAFSIALAAASSERDADAGAGGAAAGKTSNRIAGGATEFKLVGIALGAFVHSHPLGLAMGTYGASMSVYTHFLGRGRDVVFPRNTAMQMGFGGRTVLPLKPPQANPKKQ